MERLVFTGQHWYRNKALTLTAAALQINSLKGLLYLGKTPMAKPDLENQSIHPSTEHEGNILKRWIFTIQKPKRHMTPTWRSQGAIRVLPTTLILAE